MKTKSRVTRNCTLAMVYNVHVLNIVEQLTYCCIIFTVELNISVYENFSKYVTLTVLKYVCIKSIR